ncbi:MAG: class I tRNA ligase family protein [Rickettsiales bacterium]|jgi:methionyl-tRNA synthetase|nr:class I tRNA ligase family protein [Rickettsiales bacterium]
MAEKYITTPIYYPNGAPHLGSAYTTAMCDILRRAFKLQGDNVFFTTGTDEHGQKMQDAAAAAGLPFEEFAAKQSARFKQLADELGATPDFFIRTTMPEHKKIVQEWLADAHAKKILVKKKYKGLYCVGCEQFKKESDLDARGLCADHQKAPTEMEEENYLLPLEPHREWLVGYINENPEWIQPESYRAEVLNMLKEPLDDLSISRPKKRVSAGIEFPFDTDQVAYVWYDALINYITSLRINKFDSLWKNSIHVIGKDILKAHCIYWPIMLRSFGLPPAHRTCVHAFWTGEGGVKMSKSLGNTIDPFKVIGELGADALRFYFAHNAAIAKDSVISEDLLKKEYGVLANNFGNLYLRTFKMMEKYSPDMELSVQPKAPGIENLSDIKSLAENILNKSSELNLYIDKTQPWSLAKDGAKREELLSVLKTLGQGVLELAYMARPIMPAASANIIESFKTKNPVVLFPKLEG